MRNVTEKRETSETFRAQLACLLGSYRSTLQADDLLLRAAMREYEDCCVESEMRKAA